MPNLNVDITNTQIFTALGNFFKLVLPDVEVIIGQGNLVPMPQGPFISMTQSATRRLATNQDTYTDLCNTGPVQGSKNIITATEVRIAVNMYGDESPNWAATMQSVFRDDFAYDNFPSNIKPLYMDDPVQMALIDGEQQFVERWKFDVVLMYTPTVAPSQQFAQVAALNIFESVDNIPS